MPRPRRPRHSLPRHMAPRRVRLSEVPVVPSMRPDDAGGPGDSPAAVERESAEEAAVRRMVEAAYT